MARDIAIIFLLMFGGLAISRSLAVEPGCSFNNNECVYSIKLGHEKQCDSVTPTTGSANTGTDCCSKYSSLKDDVEQLKVQMGVLESGLKAGASASDMDASLQKALADNNDITKVLKRREAELSDTKKELADAMSKAADEIEKLREDLAKCRKATTSCLATLNASEYTTDTSLNTDSSGSFYDLTYYNFNEFPEGFKLTSQSGNTAAMKRLHKGTHGGPSTEHSWGTTQGYYLGIDTVEIAKNSYDSTVTKTAKATSPAFEPAEAYCILFWYYMEGPGVSTLTTNVKINGGEGYPIFYSKGAKGTDKWQLAQIALDSEYTSYQFQIDLSMTSEAYQKYKYSGLYDYFHLKGEIAVDDLYVYNTSCNNVRHYPRGAYSFKREKTVSYYTFHPTAMSWTEAYDVCRRESPWSGLVSIETDEEQQFLVNLIKKDVGLNAVGKKGFYTSGTDNDLEQHFVWTNTGLGRDVTTSQWHTGQPNNVAGNQDCLLMEYPNSNYEWGDVDCKTKHPFICEVEVAADE